MKIDTDTFPETLREAVSYFSDAERAFQFMVSLRWTDGKISCPRCGCERHSFLSTRKVWKCSDCKKQFSAKVGTIFEDSPLGYDKWFPAFWLIVNAKNGISSCELARSIGVTQKSAWHMLHRLRLAMQEGTFEKMTGNVEVDETYIGPKAAAMNKRAKRNKPKGTGMVGKSVVQGILERTTENRASRVRARVAKNARRESLMPNVRESVAPDAEVHTDSLPSYIGLNDAYTHNVIDHHVSYANGHIHTNGLENFWSLLKRMVRGTYVCPAPYHLFRYLDEQVFRFNERKDDDQGRFLTAIKGIIGRRLRYDTLINSDGLPACA